MPALLRHLSRSTLAAVAVTVACFAAAPAQAATCAGADAAPLSAGAMPAAKGATLCLVNNERAAAGLAPLAAEPTLEGVADGYSQAMVAQRVFAHVLPDGRTLQTRLAAYLVTANGWDIAENLAWGAGPLATPAAIVDGWMHSDGHRANILDPEFTEIGIGIASGSPIAADASAATYTADFGFRGSPVADQDQPTLGAAPSAPPVARSAAAPVRRVTRAMCTKAAIRRVSKSRLRGRVAGCARAARR